MKNDALLLLFAEGDHRHLVQFIRLVLESDRNSRFVAYLDDLRLFSGKLELQLIPRFHTRKFVISIQAGDNATP